MLGIDAPRSIGIPLEEFDPGRYIVGYKQLSRLGVGFYPIRPDKSPAVTGKLSRAATTDLTQIWYWAERQHHRNFAMRIQPGSPLFAIDTEHPLKHPDKPGPDGELTLGELLVEHDLILPPCPTVATGSDGRHRYLLAPKWLPIRSTISLWPGVDILAAGSNVILAGSVTEAGPYRLLRSFDACPIPDAPRSFAELIRHSQKQMLTGTGRSERGPVAPYRLSDAASPSEREWFRLFHNDVFRRFWKRERKLADSSDSAYEYHLAKACFCCGLNPSQVVVVIEQWWKKHGIERRLQKLVKRILPAAWEEVEPWVAEWRADQDASAAARAATKTKGLILAHIKSAGSPQTPLSIAEALPIPRERAKKAMQRMAAAGLLERTEAGYSVYSELGTF